jgi:hypothetical protein
MVLMEDYEVLYHDEIPALYSQIALFDAKVKDAYPQWKTGEEAFVFGQYGVVVLVATDQKINVFVCRGKGIPEHKLCVSGEIEVISNSIEVGNVPAAHTACLPFPNGRYSVVIYTDDISVEARKVFFFINSITSR